MGMFTEDDQVDELKAEIARLEVELDAARGELAGEREERKLDVARADSLSDAWDKQKKEVARLTRKLRARGDGVLAIIHTVDIYALENEGLVVDFKIAGTFGEVDFLVSGEEAICQLLEDLEVSSVLKLEHLAVVVELDDVGNLASQKIRPFHP